MKQWNSGVSKLALMATVAFGLAACGEEAEAPKTKAEMTAEATAFIQEAEQQLFEAAMYLERMAWVNANFVTHDTDMLVAEADKKFIALGVELAGKSKKYQGVDLPDDIARKFEKLRLALTLPAPENADKTKELADIKAKLSSTYATGKVAMEGEQKTLGQVSEIIATDRTPERLLAAWDGWRKSAQPMKDDYARMVEIANEGAKELGYPNVGAMWRSNYDMDPDAFAAEADRLWDGVKPLYDALHCHVRAELSDYYGSRVVSEDGAIPAHLLGNMWAQSWGNVFDLVKPEGGAESYDLTKLLQDKNYDARKMAGAADDFFQSLGFDALPDTFWDRSLFTKPEDREVQCHASAWDLDWKDDIRIKMCTKVDGEDFITMHHEVGHNIYQRAYQEQSFFGATGAHDGFHEAIGDMVALSITPDYLIKTGLLDEAPSADADIAILMQQALDKVAFLPFGLMVDQWRWKVFSGELTPDTYNQGWWDLREKYQGVKAPNDRPADAFDPGAKYHIPGNTPYMRYFLAHILQFQFHKSACEQAGWEGPLHRCSVYGNKEVGEKFKAMLEMGASKPWPEALETFTGSRDMDGSAVVAYFEPLKAWLDEQNKDRTCGW
ncbi:MAG: M2 family metallopeptidase [Alphaproteobacteria bacterium]|nr:M2 family metallopeptidase [Alphaproteobacteria bacterium]